MKKQNKVFKVASLVGAGALLIGATLGGAVMYNPVDIPSIQNTSFNQGQASVDVDAIRAIAFNNGAKSVEPVVEYVNVTQEVEVEKIVEVEKDFEAFLVSLEDRGIIKDAEEVVQEINAEDEAILMALDVVNDREFLKLLEDKNIVEDDREVEILKVYSDFEDIEIVRSDFDNEIYKFKFQVKLEDLEDEVKKYVEVKVSIENLDVTFGVTEV